VHADDVADAYRRAVLRDVRGAFNVAAEPVLDGEMFARLLRARRVRLGSGTARAAARVAWRLRLQPTPPGWLDLALASPLLDPSRACAELGWEPRKGADEAFLELLEGLRERAGDETPPLDPSTGGPARVREVATGVGGADDAERT
jgi:nucleoside-diphosphate-sugar epimerase